MAILPNSPFGTVRGRLGNIVYYPLNGKQVMRTIGAQGRPSIKQLANYQKMSVTMTMLRQMKTFVNASFAVEAAGTDKNAHNLAVSYNKKQALQGVYPNLSIDYSKVVLSNGKLPLSEDIKVLRTASGLSFSWSKKDVSGYSCRREDMVMILVYFPCNPQAREELNAAKRSAGQYEIELHPSQVDQPMEIYLCFKAADGKSISNSVYLGNINGPGNPPLANDAEKEKAAAEYAAVKARFDVVEAKYLQKMDQFKAKKIKYKAVKSNEREYEVLKAKLEMMPGKPVPAD